MVIHTKEQVKVLSIYDPETGRTVPYRLNWDGKTRNLLNLSYYHRERFGTNTRHIYHVTDGELDFRLFVDSDTLSWTLEEISDGN